MFEHILVPTDGSETASEAVGTGIELAAEQDATVHGLYVVKPMYGDEGGAEDALEALRQAGERTLAELTEQADAAGVTVTTEVTKGTPHEKILEYTEANDVDLVVMGTHGRTGIGRYLLGSVTERVVRLSPAPVLTIRPDQHATE